ncbi:MAG: phosphoglucosamine mutase [Bacteroidales bacterium]|nr:phosphoglucosamine mutase [Bacteroidales bacterium]
MSLIKSISGIRGTIGGKAGDNLTPIDLVRFVSAYATIIKQKAEGRRTRVVVGRDARVSGQMVRDIVCGTLVGMGIDVTDIGLATTPTTEIAVTEEKADGGIIITASHNPMQWNALKMLDSKGEFLTDKVGKEVLRIAAEEAFEAATVEELGTVVERDYTDIHIEKALKLELVDVEAVRKAKLTVGIDTVNSVGGIILPRLFEKMGVEMKFGLNTEANGRFAHNPEPIPQNLGDICKAVKESKTDVAFVVDPDVDRLAIVCEDGELMGEEYTIVSVADYVLSHTKGSTVSNLSSSRALRDVTEKHGCSYTAAAVGEVNVVTEMRRTGAVIGGEGNGGVIYPALHYGRDAIVGIALFLTLMAKSGKKPTELKAGYPQYVISKNRIDLTPDTNVDALLSRIKESYKGERITDIDGVKIDFADSWVHLRKSNTEPIIRIYAEAHSEGEAEKLAARVKEEIKSLV